MEEGSKGEETIDPGVQGVNQIIDCDLNRYETEESAIFVDYQVQSLTKSIKSYDSLSVYERNSLAKNIYSVRQVVGSSPEYFHWLQQLASSNEDIQKCLLAFIRQKMKRESCSHPIHEQFVLPLTKMAVGSSSELKEQSCSLLCQVLSSFNQDCSPTIELAVNLAKQEVEENKISSLYLVSGLISLVPEGERPQLYQICCSVYQKASVKFKKQIIQRIWLLARPQTGKFIDEEVINGFFLERCRQPIWAIRKSCVESLPQLVCLSRSKKEALCSCLLAFTKDGSKVVRLTAFKKVPQFIAKYGSGEIPNSLFELYLSLLSHPINKELNRDIQLLQKISFYFPGVVQTCGPSKWSKLNDIMLRILKNKSKEIKIPIASSLHHIARSIKQLHAQNYLFPVIDQLLKEESEDIKLEVVRVFSRLLQAFDQKAREHLIDFFLVLQKDSKRWRIRYQVARQLGQIARLYSSDFIFQYIFPITLKLCNDTHSQVRTEAAQHVYEVVLELQKDKQIQVIAIESIIYLGSSSVYLQRQIFCLMVQKMLSFDIFQSRCKEVLLSLAQDRAVGVRVALAHAIGPWSLQVQSCAPLSDVLQVLEKDSEQCVVNELKEPSQHQ